METERRIPSVKRNRQNIGGADMYYERKIRYLDYLERGQRVKGGGYVKLEVRDERLLIELTVTGLHMTDSYERDVFLLGKSVEKAAGKICILQGKGKYREEWNRLTDIAGTGISYQELYGLRIPLGAGREISCRWQINEKKAEASCNADFRAEEIKAAEFTVSREILPKEREDMAVMKRQSVYQPVQGEAGTDDGGKCQGAGLLNQKEGGTDRLMDQQHRKEPTEIGLEDDRTADHPKQETAASGMYETVYQSSLPEREEKRQSTDHPRQNIGGAAGNSRPVYQSEQGERETDRSRAKRLADIRGEAAVREREHRTAEFSGRGVDDTVRITKEPERGGGRNLTDHGRERSRTGQKPVKLLENKWDQLWEIYPHIRPFNDAREYISIGPSDFVLFPEASYHTVNNSFLLHGYYNYKHLLLARVERKGEAVYYIGVPGNFFEKEKQVAIMFGFESFECAEEPAQAGDFGYYMMRTGL